MIDTKPWNPNNGINGPATSMPTGKGGKGGAPGQGPYNQTKYGNEYDNYIVLDDSYYGFRYDTGRVDGGAGNDTIRGGKGNFADWLSGDEGNDVIYANGSGDNLFGGADNDILYGDGSTFMYGGTGSDTLFGGNDNDTLDGGYGRDWLKGGGGADTFRFSSMDRASWSDDGIEDFSRAEGDKIMLKNMQDWHGNRISVCEFNDLNIVDYGDHWKVFIDHDVKFGVLKGDYGHLQASDFIFDSV